MAVEEAGPVTNNDLRCREINGLLVSAFCLILGVGMIIGAIASGGGGDPAPIALFSIAAVLFTLCGGGLCYRGIKTYKSIGSYDEAQYAYPQAQYQYPPPPAAAPPPQPYYPQPYYPQPYYPQQPYANAPPPPRRSWFKF